ncbi:hypothetical protein QE152_g29547 [Popillia japonica]|uniref:Uncharacterized protein n=1 Tax=Popillia japonica TaxID=7064 RepID=A0AAW1JHI0_POPJA
MPSEDEGGTERRKPGKDAVRRRRRNGETQVFQEPKLLSGGTLADGLYENEQEMLQKYMDEVMMELECERKNELNERCLEDSEENNDSEIDYLEESHHYTESEQSDDEEQEQESVQEEKHSGNSELLTINEQAPVEEATDQEICINEQAPVEEATDQEICEKCRKLKNNKSAGEKGILPVLPTVNCHSTRSSVAATSTSSDITNRNANVDFDSDDSVADPNYISTADKQQRRPENTESDLSEEEVSSQSV